MDVAERMAHVESLLDRIDADEAALEAVQSVVELYGEALARIMAGADPVEDDLVSQLLLVHDLHPVPLEARVERALDEVRPYLRSHGGDVELLGLADGVARVRLQGSCDGCPSSATTMRLAIEDALQKAAPELERIEAEGVAEQGLLQIGSAKRSWAPAGVPAALGDGGTMLSRIAGEAVLFAQLDGTFYAYRDGCPACGGSLETATVADGALRCACGAAYDVRLAGRSADVSLSLEPLPLLVGDDGEVRVAVAG
jgi:Fe-S cluster biogenesis protein NfuA/nitrite reductase/ring-hydroxylating ferredoxin subunit